MWLLFCFCWMIVEADYKFERQSVYGLTELVEEFQGSAIGSLITNPRYIGVARFQPDVSLPQVDVHLSFEQVEGSASEYLWIIPYDKLLEMNNDIQDCQDRMQILEPSLQLPLMDDTSNERCTQRDMGGNKVRITCDFKLPITVTYPPEAPASIKLPNLQDTIQVNYPFEVFFALANCQRSEPVRADYRISIDREIGYMRYYYFADVPDSVSQVTAKIGLLSFIAVFYILTKMTLINC